MYGTGDEDGVAEAVLGDAIRGRRDNVIVSTKFGRRATVPFPPAFNAAELRRSVHDSLRRLQTDRIDLLFFHSPFDRSEIDDDVWEELDRLRDEGLVRLVGHSISKFADTQAMARQWAGERRIDAIQVVLSLMNRESTQLVEELASDGMAVLAREILANGFLSGTIGADSVFPAGHVNARYGPDEMHERVAEVDRMRFLVRGGITSLSRAAVRWVLDMPGVSAALVGARTASEIEDCCAASGQPSYSPEELVAADAAHHRDFDAA